MNTESGRSIGAIAVADFEYMISEFLTSVNIVLANILNVLRIFIYWQYAGIRAPERWPKIYKYAKDDILVNMFKTVRSCKW